MLTVSADGCCRNSWPYGCSVLLGRCWAQGLVEDAGARLRAPRRVWSRVWISLRFHNQLIFFLFLNRRAKLKTHLFKLIFFKGWCHSLCPRLVTNPGNERRSYATTHRHDDFPSVSRLGGGRSRHTPPGMSVTVKPRSALKASQAPCRTVRSKNIEVSTCRCVWVRWLAGGLVVNCQSWPTCITTTYLSNLLAMLAS